MRVLFLTKYPRLGPSSRYRVFQYIPHLEREGFECTVQSLHTPAYLESLFGGGTGASPIYHAARALRRIARVASASRYRVVFVQKEILPFAPPLVEFFLRRGGARVVYDLDDAIHLRYTESASPLLRLALGGKIATVLQWSDVVLAGNEYLREFALRLNPNSVLVPTVVDTDRYAAVPREGPAADRPDRGSPPVVGWIGSSGTVRFLAERGAALRRLATEHPFTLRVIGAPRFTMPGVSVEAVPWREDDEATELRRCDVGIMPLPDTPWARGKCGLKLLQYMAAGLPVVASPDGGARDILRHGEHGFIARSEEDWIGHLRELLRDASLRERLGRAGRARVEERYSLRIWAPRIASILRLAAAGERVEGRAW